jgi:hypothetical protein
MDNLYGILGVEKSTSPRAISAAFRDRERARERSMNSARDLYEAHRILSDPDRRAAYDRSLSRPPVLEEPISVPFDFAHVVPSCEEMVARFHRNFEPERAPKSECIESLHIEVVLDPDRVRQRSRLWIGVPVLETCAKCRGLGRTARAGCPSCRGRGRIEKYRRITLEVPRTARDRALFELGLVHAGIENFYLQVEVRLDASAH